MDALFVHAWILLERNASPSQAIDCLFDIVYRKVEDSIGCSKPRRGWLADLGNHAERTVSFFPGSVAMKHRTYLQPKQTCH